MVSPKNVPSAPAPDLIHCINCEVASDPWRKLLPQAKQNSKWKFYRLTTQWNLPLSTIYWSVGNRGLSTTILYIKAKENRVFKRIKWLSQFCNHITFSFSLARPQNLANKTSVTMNGAKRTPVMHRISQSLKTTKRRSNHNSLPEYTALEGARHAQVLINRLINCP